MLSLYLVKSSLKHLTPTVVLIEREAGQKSNQTLRNKLSFEPELKKGWWRLDLL